MSGTLNEMSLRPLHVLAFDDYRKAVTLLGNSRRIALSLRYGWRGGNPMGYEDIGRAMGISGSWARSLVMSARGRLMTQFRKMRWNT